MVAGGVKELILVAQDSTAYGQDLSEDEDLLRLVTDLADINGLSGSGLCMLIRY